MRLNYQEYIYRTMKKFAPPNLGQASPDSELKLNRVRQFSRGIFALGGLNKMLERRSPLDTRGKRLEVPEVAQSAEDGGRAVGHGAASSVGALLLDNALANPRRNKKSRNAATQTVELEGVVASGGHLLGVSKLVGARGERRRNMVMEATGLVEGQDKKSFVPLRAGAERLVDVLDERFAVGDETGGVHGVGADVTAGRVDEGEFG